uniref:MBL fold metallo-hydrolase n=1 Tax=Microbulbifer agarilyticus TaxID=260552 RepID=UPI000255B841|nr:MBL fold metallo-hydrolase [Microbulbifer agarilyticus]
MSVIESFRHHDLEALRVGRLNMGVNSSFVVYRLHGTLVDCGPSNQWKHVKRFVQSGPMRQLLLTHHHEDHSGNAGAIQQLTEIQPLAPPATVEILRQKFKVPGIRRFVWGEPYWADAAPLPEELHIGKEPVQALFSPGHTVDMTCYLLPERGWLFSADLYIANYLKMLHNGEHLPTLLNSIRDILAQDFDTILCPHRGIVESGHLRLREKYEFLLNLASNAQDLRRQGYSPKEVTRRLLGKEPVLAIITGFEFSKQRLIRASLKVNLNDH